ncbi:hypothetical protein MSMTP_1306 [Methanosarcina sp. MTP4]|nr:hypothetical protein MSMTP_1306 [Methanosarcina sp. MTP4]
MPNINVYGLLLTRDFKHPLSKMVSERWYDLHNLTGSNFLLIAFNPPTEWRDDFKKYWTEKLGEEFEIFWEEWKSGFMPGGAVQYGDLFEPEIKISQYPCLILFTDPNNLECQKVVVRSLPDWDVDSLYYLLSGMIESIKECGKKPEEKRLECLQSSLTSPTAKFLDHYKHVKMQALDYMKKHPSQILLTTANFIFAFSSANILSLGETATILLDVIKKMK